MKHKKVELLLNDETFLISAKTLFIDQSVAEKGSDVKSSVIQLPTLDGRLIILSFYQSSMHI